MWPYIIRIKSKALLILMLSLTALFLFWYYLLVGSKDKLITSQMVMTSVDLKKLLIASVIASVRGGHEVVRVRESNALLRQSKGKTREGADDVLTQGDLSSHRAMVHALSASYPGLKIISEEHSSVEDNVIEIEPIHVSRDALYGSEYSAIPFGLEAELKELTVWVDPLDATKEYSEGLTQYVTTMVCVARNGLPIIGVIHKPFSSETYWSLNSKYLSQNTISALNHRKPSNDSFRAIVSRSHAGDVKTAIQTALGTQYKNIEVVSAAGAGYKTVALVEGKADAYVHTTLIKKWDICAPNALINAIRSAHMTTLDGQTISYEEPANNELGLLASIGHDHTKLVQFFGHK